MLTLLGACLLLVILGACGSANRTSAFISGYTKVCIDGVTYLQ